jgi:hypothetical protein
MNWDRIMGHWKQFKGIYAGMVARKANEKQLAEWLARQHKADPIHK